MSVDYNSRTYVGIYAGSDQENAESYLISRGLLKEDELEDKYDGDIQWMHRMGFPLQVECENAMTGEGYYIGFQTHPSNYKDFDGLIQRFAELTGDTAEVITFTRVS